MRAVANAVRRSRAGLQDPNRPIGSFIFLGPTGVGKTETARALAEFLFDDEHAMVRIDMSEYMEKHAVARLIGAPPGYVGYEEGGQLTEAVRRRPYSVMLFDEIEKAHPGRVQHPAADSRRRPAHRFAGPHGRFPEHGDHHDVERRLDVHPRARARRLGARRDAGDGRAAPAVQPEFLNRVDDVIIFRPLGTEQIEKIVDLQLKRLEKLLADRKITLEVTPEAKRLLAEEGYDPAFGARPLKRAIQRLIQNPLAMAVLEGKFSDGDAIVARPRREGRARVLERREARRDGRPEAMAARRSDRRPALVRVDDERWMASRSTKRARRKRRAKCRSARSIVRDGAIARARDQPHGARSGSDGACRGARHPRRRPRRSIVAPGRLHAVCDARAVRDVRGRDRARAHRARGVRRVGREGGNGGIGRRFAAASATQSSSGSAGGVLGAKSARNCSRSSSVRGRQIVDTSVRLRSNFLGCPDRWPSG